MVTGCKSERPATATPPQGHATGVSAQLPSVERHATAASNATCRPTRLADGTFSCGSLRYVELVTGGASSRDALPMVVVFHGGGGNSKDFIKNFDNFHGRARFVAPISDEHRPGKPNSYQWFPLNTQDSVSVVAPTTAHYAGVVRELANSLPTKGKPIITGFSNGARLTYSLALLYPDVISAAFPVAGQLTSGAFEGMQKKSSRLPELHAFYGDKSGELESSTRTVDSFKRIGYSADLRHYATHGHEFAPARQQLFPLIERATQRASIDSGRAKPTAVNTIASR
jgi:phospholipase/carboxylesterase